MCHVHHSTNHWQSVTVVRYHRLNDAFTGPRHCGIPHPGVCGTLSCELTRHRCHKTCRLEPDYLMYTWPCVPTTTALPGNLIPGEERLQTVRCEDAVARGDSNIEGAASSMRVRRSHLWS